MKNIARPIILSTIIFLITYLVGVSFTGFVAISQTCCSGDNCPEDEICDYRKPFAQDPINIIIEIILGVLIFSYVLLHVKNKRLKR